MGNEEKKGVWWYVFGTMGMITMIVMILANGYAAWATSTMEISAQAECKVNEMQYVNLSGDGECLFLMVSSETENISICGLPQDFHCTGLMQDFPIAKLVVGAMLE